MSVPARILIVDDERTIVSLLAKRIELAGFSVMTALDPIQAKQILQREAIDLVLLDLMMPAGGGLDVLRYMKQSTRHVGIPVIVVSAAEDPELINHVKQVGITAFLKKPWQPAHLVQVIRDALPEAKRPAPPPVPETSPN